MNKCNNLTKEQKINSLIIDDCNDNKKYQETHECEISTNDQNNFIALASGDYDNYAAYNDKVQNLPLNSLNTQRGKSDLDYISLDPIIITPDEVNKPQILNLQQTFKFPSSFLKKPPIIKENCTQTSKTLIEIIQQPQTMGLLKNNYRFTSQKEKSTGPANKIETNQECINDPEMAHLDFNMVKTSITEAVPFNDKFTESPLSVRNLKKNNDQLKNHHHRISANVTTYTRKLNFSRPESRRKFNRKKTDYLMIAKRKDALLNNYNDEDCDDDDDNDDDNNARGNTTQKNIYCNSYNNSKSLPIRVGISSASSLSAYSNDITLASVIDKLQDTYWEISMEGLHELLYIAPAIDWTTNEKEISIINRKIIDMFRSPRSSVCRASCQTAGELFRILKCTKRPEFDDIIEILLCKTADSNRFIQKDANIALDKMVTYISSYHAVRVLCSKGPIHKNHMVRTATARLLVCVCAINGVDNILGINANRHTRKRILSNLGKFLTDKNLATRKFGERMCKMLGKHKFFQEYFYKDLEINDRIELKKILNSLDVK